jgi:hypothetical protein
MAMTPREDKRSGRVRDRRDASGWPRCLLARSSMLLGNSDAENLMRLLSARTTMMRRNLADPIFRYGPAAAALVYPLALVLLHLSGLHFVRASDAADRVWAGITICFAAALICTVPVLSFSAILWSVGPRERLLAHLAFAAPPLFTLTGVVFFLLGIPNSDYVVWVIAWLSVLALATTTARARAAPTPSPSWIRSAHGITAAVIVVIFLVWHLANHVVAVWSLDANKQVWNRCGPGTAPVRCSRH